MSVVLTASVVVAGLVPAIRVLIEVAKTWMPGLTLGRPEPTECWA
jgi:hypothetical protein